MSEASASYLEALSFAVERHGAVWQARKGTSFPYVVHPIRVAEILDRFGYAEDTVVAGLLHDTVEDAEVRYEELARRFGERVATLVEKPSEPDKSLDWRPRKEHTINRAADEKDPEALALIAADKLDNIRSIRETLSSKGAEGTWKLFNAGLGEQHWYYRTLAQTLLDHEPSKPLFRTIDAEVHALFPDD